MKPEMIAKMELEERDGRTSWTYDYRTVEQIIRRGGRLVLVTAVPVPPCFEPDDDVMIVAAAVADTPRWVPDDEGDRVGPG